MKAAGAIMLPRWTAAVGGQQFSMVAAGLSLFLSASGSAWSADGTVESLQTQTRSAASQSDVSKDATDSKNSKNAGADGDETQEAKPADTSAQKLGKTRRTAVNVPGELPEPVERKAETWQIHGVDCKVVYEEPFVDEPESDTLFSLSRDGLKEEMNGEIEKRAQELDDNFTINFLMEGKQPKFIQGKAAALEAMKRESERFAAHPPRRIIFSYPYAKAYGDSAVVTYKCTLVGRGENPWKSSGHVTNIFVKQNNAWKQVQRRARWKVLAEGDRATPPQQQEASQSKTSK